jgi:hypothetical protein
MNRGGRQEPQHLGHLLLQPLSQRRRWQHLDSDRDVHEMAGRHRLDEILRRQLIQVVLELDPDPTRWCRWVKGEQGRGGVVP